MLLCKFIIRTGLSVVGCFPSLSPREGSVLFQRFLFVYFRSLKLICRLTLKCKQLIIQKAQNICDYPGTHGWWKYFVRTDHCWKMLLKTNYLLRNSNESNWLKMRPEKRSSIAESCDRLIPIVGDEDACGSNLKCLVFLSLALALRQVTRIWNGEGVSILMLYLCDSTVRIQRVWRCHPFFFFLDTGSIQIDG